jgi:hypothetical protein
MTANHNWVHPSWYWLGNTVQDDGLTEHSSAENITDLCYLVRNWGQFSSCDTYRAVWALPHLLEFELLHTSLVWRDRCTLDANFMLQDSICSFDGYFVIGLSSHEYTKKVK